MTCRALDKDLKQSCNHKAAYRAYDDGKFVGVVCNRCKDDIGDLLTYRPIKKYSKSGKK